MFTAGYASEPAIRANNAAVTAGGPGILLSYVPTTELETDSYSVFDLSYNWSVKDSMTLRGGITNLLDSDLE